ncbi:MAG: C25 family peptidase propeptide domain-containing protein, partial [bacterium]
MMLFSRLLGGAFLALMMAAPAARAADPAALLPVLPVSRSLTPTAEALPGAPRQAGLPAATGDGLRLLAADDRSVEFELELGPLEFEPGPGGVAIRARGADRLAEPGEPDLPARELFIGLPQTGEVSFSADGSAPLAQSGVTVRPARAYDGREAVAATVGRDGPWPARLVELVEILDVRGRRVARVRLNPVRYDAARQELSGYRRLRVTARFEHEPRGRAAPDRFEPVLARALLNGAAAAGWRRADDPTPAGLPGAPRQAGLPAGGGFFDRSDDWCKVRTETTGVYRVRGADLVAAGYDLALIDPATLKVFSPGEWEMNGPYPDTMFEVPVLVSAANPDRFGPDDYLAFYAESPSNWRTDSAGNRYWQTNYFTRYRPWWLTWGGAPGRRFPELAAGGATSPARSVRRRARLEVDRLCPARSGLLWLWERYVKVAGRDTALFRRPLDLPGLDSIEQVSGRLYGVKSAGDRTLNYFTRVWLGELLLDTVVVTPRDRVPPP